MIDEIRIKGDMIELIEDGKTIGVSNSPGFLNGFIGLVGIDPLLKEYINVHWKRYWNVDNNQSSEK
jgi:hypothetical protein